MFPVQDQGMAKEADNEPLVEWGDYIRLEPDNCQAYCKLAKWYWDPGFKFWIQRA